MLTPNFHIVHRTGTWSPFAVFVEILPYSSDVRLVHFLETWTTSGFHDTIFPLQKNRHRFLLAALVSLQIQIHTLCQNLLLRLLLQLIHRTTLSLCRLICNPQPKRRKYIEIHLPHERISDGEFYYRLLTTIVEVPNHLFILNSIDITNVVSNSTNTICII